MAMYRKLGKKSDQRKALLRSQVTQLIAHGKIKTTEEMEAEGGGKRMQKPHKGIAQEIEHQERGDQHYEQERA